MAHRLVGQLKSLPARYGTPDPQYLQRGSGSFHWLPYSDASAILVVIPLLLTCQPTDVQAVDDVHDTHRSTLSFAPLGFGVVWTVHSVPFQCSARVTVVPELFTYSPVAVHEVEDEQDTQCGEVSFDPLGFGVD
jgi:hypothetical protein